MHTSRNALIVLFVIASTLAAYGQPLTNPYPFSIGPDVVMDTGLVVGPWDGPEPDRISVKDGHFVHEDGSPFRMVGTTLQYAGCFPDSASAIAIAQRLRALGINVVRFTAFDYTGYWPISILADGQTTTENGLHPISITRFDWFTYQLRKHGIRYGFTFQTAWVPRDGDGVRQPDSTGFGARLTVIFDQTIQRIHRDVIRMLLTHVNPFTGLAYKDDPALAFIMPLEDSPLTAYWFASKEIVNTNPIGTRTVGLVHQQLMDSTFNAFLKAKGLGNDAALSNAWSMQPSDPAEQIQNGGFEDPFDPSWVLSVNTTIGAQALMQYTESDKVSGSQCGRIRIGKLGTGAVESAIALGQVLPKVQRLHRYQLTLHAKTSASKGKRNVRLLVFHGVYPYSLAGLDETIELTSAWKKFTFVFNASTLDEAAVAMQLRCGMDTGDVYLDDVSFTEIGAPGLRLGESVSNGTVKRDVFSDPTVTPARMKSNAEFYLHQLSSLLEADKRLIRDTLKCNTLLVPSNRMYSRLDQEAAMGYDFFASTDWRSRRISALEEQYDNSVFAMSQSKYDTKPMVITHAAIQYPLPYQHELGIIYPTYSGLQQWDGVFFSIFAQRGAAGNVKVDSLSYWEIFDKPNILTQIPIASNILRRYDVATSPKVVQIAQEQEALDYPPFHSTVPYSLSVYTDSRLTLFRRTEMLSKLQPEESLVPHREVSALAGNVVDPTMLDAENGQTFFDATRGVLRTIAPRYISVAGRLAGKIVTETDVIVEQVDTSSYASVSLNSLTDKPILESSSNLLVIGGRGLNQGTRFNADGSIARWGSAPFEMEGRELRITLKAPSFDSCRIVPLGTDARPLNSGVAVARSVTGRFSLAINTKEHNTPWYKVEFFNVPSTVSEADQTPLSIAPNPSAEYAYVRSAGNVVVTCYDVLGHALFTTEGQGEVKLNTSRLPVGQYVLDIAIDGKHTTRPLSVCR